MQRRRWNWILPLFPLVLVVLPALVAGGRLIAASRLTADDVRSEFAARPLYDCGPETPALRSAGGRTSIASGQGRDVDLPAPDATFTILAVGASSLVVPSPEETFPAFLEATLQARSGSRVRMVNVGHVGATAARVCERGLVAAGVIDPDLVVIYSGHNDFTGVFRALRESRLLPIRPAEVRLLGINDHQRVNATEPALVQWLQSTGLLQVTPELLGPLTERAVAQWVHGISPLLTQLRAASIPVVLVRPVGNLATAPIGFDGVARHDWEQARLTSDATERLRGLRRARDADAFNGDIRAKSLFADALQRLTGKGVYYFDLEKSLEDNGFVFGDAEFFDFVHPRPAAHREIATHIADFILDHDLCCDRAQ